PICSPNMSRASVRWSTSRRKPSRSRPSIAIYADFAPPDPPGAPHPRTTTAPDSAQELDREQLAEIAGRRTHPSLSPGDTVQVNVKITEGERTRVQAYEGVVIAKSGGGVNENFTVRKISYGEGVERVFPLHSPIIDSVKVVRRGKVRRAKLYYLRALRGKKARIVEKVTGHDSKA